MFPVSSVLDYSDSLAFTVKGIRIPGSLHTTITLGTFMMKCMIKKLFVGSTTRNKIPPKKARGRLRQSEIFSPLAYHVIVANYVVQPGICPVLIQPEWPRLSIVTPSVSRLKCGGNQHCLHR